MAAISQSSQPRNIVFFGETGTGKSSAINLIAGSSVADTNNDTGACTRVSACYKTMIRDEPFKLWDTRGLGEAGFFHSLFKGGPEGELRKFLRERYQRQEIDLLVYCVRGSRAKEALLKNYKTFCAMTRQLAAPVVIVVTHLEREKNMEDWWERNESSLRRLGMEFDGHACITAIPNHTRENVSKQTLHELIARDYLWQAEGGGSYFGSSAQQRQRATPVVTGSATGVHNDLPSRATHPRTDTTRSEVPLSSGARIHVDSSAVAAPRGKRRFYEFWKKAPAK
ncbi:hypothetical protein BDN67DRAFT_637491 [Paxillus ammoniavirescens]|nr:hypothetical protein BDN67DRAFT_637491 [Paxillus ammoniavirescens]